MSKDLGSRGEESVRSVQIQPVWRDLIETNMVILSPHYFFLPDFETFLGSLFFWSLNYIAHVLLTEKSIKISLYGFSAVVRLVINFYAVVNIFSQRCDQVLNFER